MASDKKFLIVEVKAEIAASEFNVAFPQIVQFL